MGNKLKQIADDFVECVLTGSEVGSEFGYQFKNSNVDNRLVVGVEEYDEEGKIVNNYIGFVVFQECPKDNNPI